MQPNGAAIRPSEKPGEEAEAFAEAGPVTAMAQQPRREIDEDKRKRYKLNEAIEEKSAVDARNSGRDFEYIVDFVPDGVGPRR